MQTRNNFPLFFANRCRLAAWLVVVALLAAGVVPVSADTPPATPESGNAITAIVVKSVETDTSILGWVLLAQGLGLLLIIAIFAWYNRRDQRLLQAALSGLPENNHPQ